jgi:hypothetical protein
MKTVITLVHGTWARRSKWTLDESSLCQELRRELGDVEFRRVPWSGRNHSFARTQAARKLRDSLVDAFDKWPTARHAVIAHSHGGNAAMYVLREPALQRRVSAVITLATPFLHVVRPPLSSRSLRLAITYQLWGLFASVFLIVLGMSAWSPWTRRALPPLDDPAVIVALVIVVVASFVHSRRWDERAAVGIRSFAARIQRDTRLPSALATRVLVVRATGDETTIALAATSAMAGIVSRVASITNWVAAVVDSMVGLWRRDSDPRTPPIDIANLLPVLIIIPSSYMVGRRIYGALILAEGGSVNLLERILVIIASYFGGMLGGVGINLAVCFLAMTLTLGVLAALHLARAASLFLYGADVALASFALSVTTESTPPGIWQLLHVPPTPLKGKQPTPWTGLAHSELHGDPRVFAEVAAFIRDSAPAPVVAPAPLPMNPIASPASLGDVGLRR